MGKMNSFNDDGLLNPSYTEQPTRLDMALALFERTGVSEGMGSVHALSVRIPTLEYASIEALAKLGGISRNKVITELLGIALDEVWQGLSDESRAQAVQLRSEMLDGLLKADTFEQAGKGDI